MGVTLDITVGLFSIYLMLAVLCSAVNEALAGALRLRAWVLRRGLDTLLTDHALDDVLKKVTVPWDTPPEHWVDRIVDRVAPMGRLTTLLCRHPLVAGLKHGWVGPSYIPSQTFVCAFLDLLKRIVKLDKEPDDPVCALRARVQGLPESSLIRGSLCALLDETVTDAKDAQARIVKWFDDAMDRASGRYKRWTHVRIALVALVASAVLNADSIQIAESLSKDGALREAMVAAAQQIAKQPPRYAERPKANAPRAADTAAQDAATPPAPPEPNVSEDLETIGEIERRIERFSLPVGWGKVAPPDGVSRWGWVWWWLKRIFTTPGLVATAIAASLGAPFWFDLLNKLVNLRTAGRTPPPPPAPAPPAGA